MTLCEICKSIPFGNLPDFPSWLPGSNLVLMERDLVPFLPMNNKEWKKEGKTPGLPHHHTLETLRAAAKFCDVCQLIDIGTCRVLELLAVAYEMEGYKYSDRSGPPTHELFVCKRPAGGDGFVVLSPSEKNYAVYLMGAVGYCVDYDSEMKDKLRGRVVLPDPTSPNILGRMRTWLHECQGNHEHEKPVERQLPARILDVGSQELGVDQIRLCEPKGEMGHYATLSHCWGTSQQLTTTKETLEQRKSSIDLSSLSQTFQDAVRITRELGLRYLWLDGLCICQDDLKDWERESSVMGDIYANAYISISAMRSLNDTDGFLSPRPTRRYFPLELVFNETPATVLAFALPLACAAHGSRYVAMEHDPLTKRAWALQERYMAPRILHFSSSQISFECDENFLTEDGFCDKDRTFTLNKKEEVPHPLIPYRGPMAWMRVVYLFSERQLTRPSDKLPALSGLVRAFHKANRGSGEASLDYVAGLWRQNIIEDLCWQSIGGRGIRPQEYRAPSWSWASLDGPIAVSGMADFTDIAEVDEISVEVPGENPYGEITGGYLRLRCSLIPVRLSHDVDPRWANAPVQRVVSLKVEGGDPYGYSACFDVRDEIDRDKIDEMNLFIMPMAWKSTTDHQTNEERKCALALIVQPCTGPSGDDQKDINLAFRRIGFLLATGNNLIESWASAKEKRELSLHTLV